MSGVARSAGVVEASPRHTSFTAKDAKPAKEKKSLNAKAAKDAKNNYQKPNPKVAKTTLSVVSG